MSNVADVVGFAQKTFNADGIRPLENYHLKPEADEQSHLQEVKTLLRYQLDKDGHKTADIPEDEFLITCLRVWEYSIPNTIRVCCNFVKFRTEAKWPYKVEARNVRKELLSEVHWFLPGLDKLGRGILVFNARHIAPSLRNRCSPSCMTVEGLQKMGVFLLEQAMQRTSIVEKGIVAVFDLKGIGFDIVSCFSLGDMQRGVNMWKEAFPCKLKKLYFVGLGFFLEATVNTVLAMLSKKIQQRVVVVPAGRESDVFGKDIGRDQVPKELGGDLVFDWNSHVRSSWLADED